MAKALNLLENQSYVQRNGDIYEFLTDDEKDIEEEIKNTELISPPDFENEILSVSEKVYLELTLDYEVPVETISY